MSNKVVTSFSVDEDVLNDFDKKLDGRKRSTVLQQLMENYKSGDADDEQS